MRIRWENIFGLLLLIAGIYLFVKMRPCLENLFDDANHVHYYYGGGPEQLTRALMLGLLCLTVIAAITIFSNRRR